MAKVWFRCDRKNETMFVLNSSKEMDYVPMVGDVIETYNEDFMKATFRIKPWSKEKDKRKRSDSVWIEFKVVSRKYCTMFDQWELICEPTAESLLFLLKSVKRS